MSSSSVSLIVILMISLTLNLPSIQMAMLSVNGTMTALPTRSQTSTTTTTTITASSYRQNVIQYDKEKNCASDQHIPTTWETYLTHFACGHLTIFNNNGTTLRQFTFIVDDNHGG
jgi:hypothetical protein